MAYQQGVRVDKTHDVILHFAQSFRRPALQIARAYSGKASVVVDNVALGKDETLVDEAALNPDNGQLDEFEAVGGEAHLPVDRVYAVVAVRRVALSSFGSNETLERAVHSRLGQVPPDMNPTLAAASAGLGGWGAAAGEAVVLWPTILALAGSQLAPVIGAALFCEILSLRTDIKDLAAT